MNRTEIGSIGAISILPDSESGGSFLTRTYFKYASRSFGIDILRLSAYG